MNVTVIGTGYVGLVTGTCLAEVGNDVVCVDIDSEKVKRMQNGEVPIYEPGLEELFARNIKKGRLNFTDNLQAGVLNAEVIFLSLPTPPSKDGSPDLSYIFDVADQLGKLIKDYAVVVDKSTVPVGTSKKVHQRIAKHCKSSFDVASNPEFLREGLAINDFLKPDRIVLGANSKKALTTLKNLYAPLVRQGAKLLVMDEASAEMTKYAANTFLAIKITFMNEIANLCEKLDADVDSVRMGIGSDDRIGNKFLYSGIGFGGSCFPKDVLGLYEIAKETGYDFKILDAVNKVNQRQKHVLFEKVSKYYNGKLSGKTFALWGLAFKPDTDDIREAPALEIISDLLEAGANVVAYDPQAIANVQKIYEDNKGISFVDDEYKALNGADALLIATEWDAFKEPDFKRIKKQLLAPIIFDGRNLYELEAVEKEGFYYQSIGRRIILNAKK